MGLEREERTYLRYACFEPEAAFAVRGGERDVKTLSGPGERKGGKAQRLQHALMFQQENRSKKEEKGLILCQKEKKEGGRTEGSLF